MLRKSFAALGAAAIILLATPVAAQAATTDECGVGGVNYALPGTVSSDAATVGPDGTVTVTWDDEYFTPSAPVDITTSGPGAVGSEVVAAGTTSTGTGSMWVTVTPAVGVSGALTVTGSSDCATGGVTVQVTGDPAAAAVASDSLASTGSSLPIVLIIAGAGALTFGAILLMARARGRRRLHE